MISNISKVASSCTYNLDLSFSTSIRVLVLVMGSLPQIMGIYEFSSMSIIKFFVRNINL